MVVKVVVARREMVQASAFLSLLTAQLATYATGATAVMGGYGWGQSLLEDRSVIGLVEMWRRSLLLHARLYDLFSTIP